LRSRFGWANIACSVRRSPLKAGRSVLGPDGKVMAHGTTAVLVLGNVK
jgi:hypothetical protein